MRQLQHLIDLLIANPWLLIVLGAWLVGVVGRVFSGAGRKAQEAAQRAREEAQRRMRERVERQEPAAKIPAAEPVRRRVTQEEAIAEMRRLLGDVRRGDAGTGDEEARQLPKQEAREEPRRVPIGERPRRLGQVEVHVDPHVGESIQQRRAPASGQVGQHELGGLGGRTVTQAATALRQRPGLVSVHDLKRMLVMREVLGPPLALRPDWGPGRIG